MYLEYNGNKYEVLIEKKNNKNTYIRVKEDLKIHVTTNRWTSEKQIEKLLLDNVDSVKNMINKQQRKKEVNSKTIILGKEVDLIGLSSQKEPELYNNKFYIKDINNYDKYLKEYAYIIFRERMDIIYKSFYEKIPYPILKIRKMTSRWGVCNKKAKSITLNFELIKKDVKYLDYVILHELCHFIYFDHSKDFWNLVSKYNKNYKLIRKEMRD